MKTGASTASVAPSTTQPVKGRIVATEPHNSNVATITAKVCGAVSGRPRNRRCSLIRTQSRRKVKKNHTRLSSGTKLSPTAVRPVGSVLRCRGNRSCSRFS